MADDNATRLLRTLRAFVKSSDTSFPPFLSVLSYDELEVAPPLPRACVLGTGSISRTESVTAQ